MTSSIGQSIEALCTEQGLDRDMVIEAMKDAVKAAARKQFKAQDKTGEGIQVEWNTDEQDVEISIQKTVVENVENPSVELSLTEAQELAGDEIELGDALLIPLPREEMGRIAAQTGNLPDARSFRDGNLCRQSSRSARVSARRRTLPIRRSG